ncbi:YolD-like family protein [Baia soyae]|uniref:YolD-like protein n=1 Tax=Baia soyae TaxID=1544746 RepID=A0A4R2RT71_9BACL|nr:YolD-like family protein [Baia soyae]TCP66438.1 YolD-like protein [Baia soyae]
MSKKLKGNGLFESSRMMLPEHKEAYHTHQRNLQRRSRPQRDDQEMERIDILISESMQCKHEVTLVLFTEFDLLERTGVIVNVDQQSRKIKLDQGQDVEWIYVEDVMDVWVCGI